MTNLHDSRTEDPNKSGRRLKVFRDGWAHAVAGREYTRETLERLTWQNLGWRLGSLLGATSEGLVDETYDLCVRQQAEAGVERTDS